MNLLILSIIIQLLLEVIPVSSSTHLFLLYAGAQRLGFAGGENLFTEDFDYSLHGFTALVVIIFFYNQWKWLALSWIPGRRGTHYKKLRLISLRLMGYCVLATCSTLAGYIVIKGYAQPFIHIYESYFRCGGLALSVALLLSLRLLPRTQNYETLTCSKALLIGAMQGIALLPGISRLASTYVVARFLALSPCRALQSSLFFQLAISGAGCLKGIYGLHKSGFLTLFLHPGVMVACGAGMIGSFYILKLVYKAACIHRWWMFGIYMVVPLVLTLFLAF